MWPIRTSFSKKGRARLAKGVHTAIRERNGSFQVYWNNPHTGRLESKTFAPMQEAAKEDSLVKHRLKFERESFSKVGEPEKKTITLEAVYIAYLKEKQFNKHNMSRHFSAMRPFLNGVGQAPLSELSVEKLGEIKEKTMAGTRKLATAHKRLSILRTVLRWADEKGYWAMPRFPRLPPAHYEQFVPPAPHELAAMLQVSPPHLHRVIILGSQCGVGVGPCELFALTWDDMDMEQGILRIHGARKNPNAQWREVPLRQALMPTLRQGWEAVGALDT